MITLRNSFRYFAGPALVLSLLTACGTTSEPPQLEVEEPAISQDSIAGLLQLADRTPQPEASEYLIAAVEQLIEERDDSRARVILEDVAPVDSLNFTLRVRLAIARAELALLTDDPDGALAWLDSELTERLSQQQPALQRRAGEVRGRALLAAGNYMEAVSILTGLDDLSPSTDAQHFHDLTWQALQNLSGNQLNLVARSANSYELRGWVELARSMRAQQFSIASQIDAISGWQNVWNRHSAATMLPSQLRKLDEVWNRRPRHIALLLPLQDQIGRAVQEGFLSAYYQAMEVDSAVPRVSVFDTSGVTEIRGLYETAVESGAELIIGPLNKELVRQLDNLPDLPVPTLALNYTDFTDRNSNQFYQFGLAPEDEIRQVANRAWAEGHRNAAIVAPDSLDYSRLQDAFSRTWQNLGGNVVSTTRYTGEGEYADAIKHLLAIDASEDRAARIEALLPRNTIEFTPSRRGDIDFIFLMANPRQGRQINPTLAFYFAGDVPVYALSAINDGSNNRLVNQDLNGIIFIDTPWVLSQQDALKQQLNLSLRSTQGPLQRLRALGIDSFRIYARLEQLANGELANFNGVTGALTMNRNGIIERVPLAAVFIDGAAVLADDLDSVALN